MGTRETRSRTLVSASSARTTEPAKTHVPKEKTLKEAIESSTQKCAGSESEVEGCVVVNNQENGVRKDEELSEDSSRGVVETYILGQRVFSGDDKGVIVECSKVKTRKNVREIEDEDGTRSGVVDKFEDVDKATNGEKGCLEESENDVSLDKNEDENGEVRSIEVPTKDLGENNDGEVVELGKEEHEFSVGDFVWGKVKSHPWWPGQIYDPSYASEYAAKIKTKDRYLVAYFGDRTFAWCAPSQLKPFEEYFNEMSKQSSMKTFLSAVQQATDEIGRLLELKMICSCVPKENQTGLDQPLAANAGIKKGVLAPEGDTRKLSGVLTEPSELLAELKLVAQVLSVTNVLELRVLRSRLSALYRTKGVYGLPEYHDPKPIVGLDDSEKSIEVPSQGPFEDWLPSSVSVDIVQANEPTLLSSPVFSENRKTHRRKQRSIADLIRSNKDAETKTKGREATTEGTNSEKPAPSSGVKRRKGRKETTDSEMAMERANLEKPAPPSGPKKRKGREESDSHDDSSLASLIGKRRAARLSGSPVNTSISNVSSVKKDGAGEKEKTKESLGAKGRTRTRTKKKGVDVENDDGESKTRTRSGSVSRKLKLDIGSVKSDDSAVKEQFEMGSSPRERKKSKYLSPPFTMLDSSKRKRETEIESLKVPTGERIEEEITMEADQNIGSPPSLKRSSGTLQKNKFSTEPGSGDESEKSHGTSPNQRTPVQNLNKIVDETKANVSTNEFLSELRSAAANLFTPRRKGSLDMVVGFMSLFRNTVYRNGSNYKIHNKLQSRRKRKNLDSESASQKEEPKKTAEKATEQESGRKKAKNENTGADKPIEKGAVETRSSRSARRKPKKPDGTPGVNTMDKETVEENASPAALFVTFGPGSSLPTKADLIRMYGKYGELDETETEMFYNNFCARVSFVKSSDAEVALNHSQNASPFGSASVSFRLRYHSGAFKTRELREISRQKPATPLKNNVKTPKNQRSQSKSGGDQSNINFIKQKLEKISSMLEDSNAKVAPTMKSKLKGEIKGLLEKVGTMAGGSSSS